MAEDIICKKCGLINDFTKVISAKNHAAYCNGCDAYIQNIPYDDPKFYFGKYEGMKIADCVDLKYLQWVHDQIKPKGRQGEAVSNQISKLKHK